MRDNNNNSKKICYVIRHVAFEDLGILEDILEHRAWSTQYFEAGVDDLSFIEQNQPDLLIILGGPISVNDQQDFPFLNAELAILTARMQSDLPTLGICLGAQLIAKSLGANILLGQEKEIGWYPIEVFNTNKMSFFEHLKMQAGCFLHWHGETFELPQHATRHASTAICQNQAFTYKNNILGIQFHPEVEPSAIEKWLIGHVGEINATNGIGINMLREKTKLYGEQSVSQATAFFNGWLDSILVNAVR